MSHKNQDINELKTTPVRTSSETVIGVSRSVIISRLFLVAWPTKSVLTILK